MSDETFELSATIGWGLQEHFCDGPHRRLYAGHEYETPTDEQWAALGEDPGAMDCPLIIYRPSDGKFFEIWVDVTVQETSPEIRAKQLAEHQALIARYQKKASEQG